MILLLIIAIATIVATITHYAIKRHIAHTAPQPMPAPSRFITPQH